MGNGLLVSFTRQMNTISCEEWGEVLSTILGVINVAEVPWAKSGVGQVE